VVGSVLGSGIQGVRTGMDMLARNGHEIATASVPEKVEENLQVEAVQETPENQDARNEEQPVPEQPLKDLEEPLVGLLQSKIQVQASAKVIQSGSDAIGSILDITA